MLQADSAEVIIRPGRPGAVRSGCVDFTSKRIILHSADNNSVRVSYALYLAVESFVSSYAVYAVVLGGGFIARQICPHGRGRARRREGEGTIIGNSRYISSGISGAAKIPVIVVGHADAWVINSVQPAYDSG